LLNHEVCGQGIRVSTAALLSVCCI